MIEDAYLITRLFFYTLLILFGGINFLRRRQLLDLYIGSMGLLSMLIEGLDIYVFSSNLELYAAFELLAAGLCLAILGLTNIRPVILWVIGLLAAAWTAGSFLAEEFGPHTDIHFLSNYGLIDTTELENLRILIIILLVPTLFLGLYKVLQKGNKANFTKMVITIASLIIIYAGALFLNLFGRFVMVNVPNYLEVAMNVNVFLFVSSNLLFLIALLIKPKPESVTNLSENL